MNKHSMLIMHVIAVTSVGSKTKHTHCAKNKANFTAVNTSNLVLVPYQTGIFS